MTKLADVRRRPSCRDLGRRQAAGATLVLAACALVVFGLSGVSVAAAAPVGQITEFSAGLQAGNGSTPEDIAPGPDGSLWFTDQGSTTAIGRITPSGQITEFSSTGLNNPEDIAPGPDGGVRGKGA